MIEGMIKILESAFEYPIYHKWKQFLDMERSIN